MYIYIYIYIYTERERESYVYTYIYIYIYMATESTHRRLEPSEKGREPERLTQPRRRGPEHAVNIIARRRENMVGVNMVLAEFVKFKHGLYKSCGIEWFEGSMLEPCLLQPCFHVAG